MCALWCQYRHKLDIGRLDVWVIYRMNNSVHRKHEDALIEMNRCYYKYLSIDINILYVNMQSVFMRFMAWNELILWKLAYIFQSVISFCNIIHYKYFGTILVQYKGLISDITVDTDNLTQSFCQRVLTNLITGRWAIQKCWLIPFAYPVGYRSNAVLYSIMLQWSLQWHAEYK